MRLGGLTATRAIAGYPLHLNTETLFIFAAPVSCRLSAVKDYSVTIFTSVVLMPVYVDINTY